jgi:hypothetical protein
MKGHPYLEIINVSKELRGDNSKSLISNLHQSKL